jgi:hypothetical protein
MRTANTISRSALSVAVAAAFLLVSGPASAESYQMRVTVSGLKSAAPDTDFTSHTFTNCGKAGRYGPSLSQCQSAYSGAEILAPEYNYAVSGGIQQWTVPVSGVYRIRAAGAAGGSTDHGHGGDGVTLSADYNLEKGDVIKILVGQQGQYSSNMAGGGGGTFAWVAGDVEEPLIAAGGGGGASYEMPQGVNASYSTNGTNNRNETAMGGANGHGGNIPAGEYPATAGAGWKSNGKHGSLSCKNNSEASLSPLNGGDGSPGSGNDNYLRYGGFGGGGGASARCASAGGGGGGGYSGGAGGSDSIASHDSAGGGGGSFSSGVKRSNDGYRNDSGYLIITLQE